MDNTINKKTYDEVAFKKLLVSFLKTKSEGATQNEMVVATGLSKDWVELTVRALLKDYPAHLEADEQHQLIYEFDFTPQQTQAFSLRKFFNTIANGIWKGFMLFFKIWTLLMYMSYILLNVIILLVFLVVINILAIFHGGDGIGLPKAAESGLAASLGVLIDINLLLAGVHDLSSKESFLHKMFSYLFGETKTKVDDLWIEKHLLRFISQNKGKMVVAEIVKLTGWGVRKAQEEAAQLMANYNGDVFVTDEGVIVYQFDDLQNDARVLKFLAENQHKAEAKSIEDMSFEEIQQRVSTWWGKTAVSRFLIKTFVSIEEEDKKAAKQTSVESKPEETLEEVQKEIKPINKPVNPNDVMPIWQNLVPLVRMSDNDEEDDEVIREANKFNWVMSFVSPLMLMFMILLLVDTVGGEDATSGIRFKLGFFVVLTIIPFSYSFLFWLIPRMRRFGVNRANKRLHHINYGHRFLGFVFNHLNEKLYPAQGFKQIYEEVKTANHKLTRTVLNEIMQAKSIELEAEANADEQGKYFSFTHLQAELNVAEQLRLNNGA